MVKVSELSGQALDWAVAKCEGEDYLPERAYDGIGNEYPATRYSTNWSLGGPIIGREGVTLRCGLNGWDAELPEFGILMHGSSALIAAMRCYVASKLGDSVDIPKELL